MRRKRAARVVAGAAVAVVAILAEPAYWQVVGVPSGQTLVDQQAAIYASVLTQVSRIRDSGESPWAAFCVEVLGADPAPVVLEQLGELASPAKAASTCPIRDASGRLHLPENHLILRVRREPKFLSGGLARVEAGDYLGDMAATGYEFIVVRAWGKWRAVRRTLVWIS